ncbi:hypothetical protein [Mesonia maritima]|uniref:GIY-YIG domain-containing protein n=1 Tax=Mesonia maritima TaxID=1793873 RepID=A0ABU1K2S0_9FLAO|nr:hypothetical protein [Mesonia maritima]MDR6299904.1 hypothetical protein [Mesonia maritima]
MMKIKGFNNYDLEGCFVYFIFSRELLYIGETQKITFSRWIQHFYKSGTFTKKVKLFGDSNLDYFSRVNLLSVELTDLRLDFPEMRWKTLTQAIEHSVHIELSKSQSDLIKSYYDKYEPEINRFQIVSDTSKTCPRGIPTSEWEYANNYAKKILKEVYHYI